LASAMHAQRDMLFDMNVRARAQKPSKPPPWALTPPKRQNAGWRGLSTDIDPTVGASPASAQTEPGPGPGPDARLYGRIVRAI